MTTVLVTGAGGHIGQRLTHRLASDGIGVRALVRRELEWPDGVDQVVGDLVADPGVTAHLAKGADVAIHLVGAGEAALASDPDRAIADSVAACESVLASGVPRVVYMSTVHVYGSSLSGQAVVDEATPLSPSTPYARARLACEEVLTTSATPSVVFRLTNGIGAPQQADSAGWRVVTHELCREGATRGRLTLRTPGLQWRDFVPLVNVETALSALVRQPRFPVGTYNFGSGTSITVRDLAGEIQDAFERVDGTRPPLDVPTADADAVTEAPYRIGIRALEQLELFGPTSRQEALDDVVRFCLRHKASLA
ncbi:MAG TPA: NAD(P)-dependent oxidoreductase [Acidimicrobiales bacterium]|nr:NAD(P)-dependent oxidoreductase [Acidimicrobiales bacterium]